MKPKPTMPSDSCPRCGANHQVTLNDLQVIYECQSSLWKWAAVEPDFDQSDACTIRQQAAELARLREEVERLTRENNLLVAKNGNLAEALRK